MKRIDSNLSSFPEPSANVPVLLLTAAVDARNGRDCLFSTEARKRQYLGAFRFYMRFLARHPDLCTGIVFCENSGADLAPFRSLVPDEFRSRVEFVSLPIDGFRPEMGKSWNEMRALDLTLERAGLIGSDDLFVKLTGRYPIHNIRRLVSDLVSTRFRIAVSCFRWPEGRRLSPHPPLCDTRCIAFRKRSGPIVSAGSTQRRTSTRDATSKPLRRKWFRDTKRSRAGERTLPVLL